MIIPSFSGSIDTAIGLDSFQSTVDKLFQKTQSSILIGSSSWKDQFIEAFKVTAEEDDEEEEEGNVSLNLTAEDNRIPLLPTKISELTFMNNNDDVP